MTACAMRIRLPVVHPGPSFRSGDEMILTSPSTITMSTKRANYHLEEHHQILPRRATAIWNVIFFWWIHRVLVVSSFYYVGDLSLPDEKPYPKCEGLMVKAWRPFYQVWENLKLPFFKT